MKTIAPTTDESATVEPTERSIPRVMITSSCPSASTEITAVCEKTLPMFRLVKKIGVVRLTPTTRKSRISAGPRRSARSTSPSTRKRNSPPGASAGGAVERLTSGQRATRRDPDCSNSGSSTCRHAEISSCHQIAPSGNAYSASDSGRISML